MKQIAVVKDWRIVPGLISIMNSFHPIPSNTNLPFRPFVPIEEQMRARGEEQDLSFESVLDEVLKDNERAWKTLGNL